MYSDHTISQRLLQLVSTDRSISVFVDPIVKPTMIVRIFGAR